MFTEIIRECSKEWSRCLCARCCSPSGVEVSQFVLTVAGSRHQKSFSRHPPPLSVLKDESRWRSWGRCPFCDKGAKRLSWSQPALVLTGQKLQMRHTWAKVKSKDEHRQLTCRCAHPSANGPPPKNGLPDADSWVTYWDYRSGLE